ncbi:Lichenase protein [Spatholobus suberectus]|nr:Lichenase protein [Spatholobus suberectus]
MIFVLLLLVLGGLELGTTEFNFDTINAVAQNIGVCYGRVANNLPPAQEVIDLYKANGIGRIRIYDSDPATIQALRGSNIELLVGVPNEIIQPFASAAAANNWVQNNIQKYSQDIKFRNIVVGNGDVSAYIPTNIISITDG